MTAFVRNNITGDHQQCGSGPMTLPLLPGWCEPALASERYRIISLDWHCHERSPDDVTLALDAVDLLADLHALWLTLRVDRLICRFHRWYCRP